MDEWQSNVLTPGLGMRGADWTAKKVGVWVPRQNGKGGIIECLELYWLFETGEELVVHSAHQHRTSQRAYTRMERLIRRTPSLHRQVRQYRQTNGEQGIELKDGRELQYTTRSRTALKGFSAAKVVFDEGQELTGEQIGAVLPTVSAMPNWQVWFFGTPPDDPAAWCYGLRADGEAGIPRLGWANWGADLSLDDPADLARTHDPDLWYETNPAAGIRIEFETIFDEDTPSGLGEKFPQERLGVWKPRAVGGAGVISAELWRDQIDTIGQRPVEVALVVQVNYRRTHTAIMAVGLRPAGGLLVSVVDYRPGTHWVVDRLVALKQKWNPIGIAVQDKGPTGSLLEDMAKAGLHPPEDRDKPHRGDIAVPWADDVADAYGMFVDMTLQRRLWHLDEAPLNTALAVTDTRALSGATAWDYRHPAAAPLVGATLGVWLHETWAHLVRQSYDPLSNIF
jgi:hypothetical protein